MNIEFTQYYLAQTINAHNGIVRSITTNGNELLTSSGDKTAKLFEFNNGSYIESTTMTFFENFLYSTCTRIGGGYAVGCDKQIYIIDADGNPLSVLDGHEGAVCSLYSIDQNTLISGSWDATAIVWDIAEGKPIYRLKGHTHGVAVYGIDTQNFLTGSQDGILRQWHQGEEMKKVQAHKDIIREIQPIPNIGYITSSNDETLKLWSADLSPLITFLGHKGYVFTVKQLGNYFVSGGDDRTIIIWNSEGQPLQSIKFPGAVWTIAINSISDIIVGTNDGKVRVFSTDKNRRAQQEEIDALEQASQFSEVKEEGGLSAEELKKLPSTDKLKDMKGKKEGEIRLFKNGNKPEAYMWTMESNSWVLIGDVLGGAKTKKQFPGDKYFPAGEYDYVFDVENDKGESTVIPFNEGDSHLIAAERFCAREGFSKYYLQQVINFLKQNTQASQPQQQKVQQQHQQQHQQQEQQEQQQQKNILKEYKYIPFTQSFFYANANLLGLSKKLIELNAQAGDLAMTEKEIIYFNKGIDLLGLTGLQQQQMDYAVIQIFLNKLLKWPLNLLMPVYDFFRIFSLHFSSEQLFAGLDRGINYFLDIHRIVHHEETQQVLIRLALQTLCNCFKHNANICSIIWNITIVKDIIMTPNVLNGDEKTQLTIANLILNLSIAIYQKPSLNQDSSKILSEIILEFIKNSKDVECQAKSLTAIGNLMRSTDQNVRKQCQDLCSQFVKNFKLETDNEESLQCLEEVKLAILN